MDYRTMNRYTVAAFLLFAAIVWTFWPREKPEVGVSAPLPPAKEVRAVERVVYVPKFITVYPDKSKNGLNLPKSIAADETKKLIATGKLDAEEREYSLSTVLDTETGDSQIYAKPQPLPWIGPGKRGAVGVAYGLHNGEPTLKGYAQHDLLQVKALHAGARAEVDQRGEYWLGGYVEYRW